MALEAPDPESIRPHEAPPIREIVLPENVVAEIVRYEGAAAQAAGLRDAYLAGIAAGLGVELVDVVGLDPATRTLTVKDG
jgi:hypothetical protein